MTDPQPPTITAPALTAAVRPAGRAGSTARSSEDRILTTPNTLITLDGVSTVNDEQPRGGWYAQTLGEHIAQQLTEQPAADLAQVLEEAIATLRAKHHLIPGVSPAATISIVRAGIEHLDVLVLGDSPVILLDRDGEVRQVRDDRLADLVGPRPELAELQRSLLAGYGFGEHHRDLLKALRTFQLTKINRPGGYWVAEADPIAARNAVTASISLIDVAAVLTMTDGVSCAVEDYGLYSWEELVRECASAGPAAVIDAIARAEQQDPAGQTWPRYKESDDKAAAYWLLAQATCR
ncbi:hypothetical protein [Kitasatospora sp. LaBMicrA B282]|uniref:hypothetical protein n=1 Tax=Kitasatospora sp. LaBMicrA B282 TaxID=3420949 RepID=UPI003D1134F8